MLERQIVTVRSITKYSKACSKREKSFKMTSQKIAQSCQQMKSVENNCYIPDLVQTFSDD